MEKMPTKYLDGLVSFKVEAFDTSGTSYLPVFNDNKQKEWDEELHEYISNKQAFCNEYGCE